MEWYSRLPEEGDLRIVRRFSFLPYRCQQDKVVWLEYIYKFQRFKSAGYETSSRWNTETALSPSQFCRFKKEIALNLTDPREEIRSYATLLKKDK